MKKVFQVKDLIFYEEDFLEDIKDFEDIIDAIKSDIATYKGYTIEEIISAIE